MDSQQVSIRQSTGAVVGASSRVVPARTPASSPSDAPPSSPRGPSSTARPPTGPSGPSSAGASRPCFPRSPDANLRRLPDNRTDDRNCVRQLKNNRRTTEDAAPRNDRPPACGTVVSIRGSGGRRGHRHPSAGRSSPSADGSSRPRAPEAGPASPTLWSDDPMYRGSRLAASFLLVMTGFAATRWPSSSFRRPSAPGRPLAHRRRPVPRDPPLRRPRRDLPRTRLGPQPRGLRCRARRRHRDPRRRRAPDRRPPVRRRQRDRPRPDRLDRRCLRAPRDRGRPRIPVLARVLTARSSAGRASSFGPSFAGLAG